jgi:hypothetical protein
LGIPLRSFQVGGDLPQFFLLVCGQVRLDVLGVTPHQVNAGGNHKVQIYDSGAATLAFATRGPSQLPHSARSRYDVAGIGMVNQINCYRLDPIRSE